MISLTLLTLLFNSLTNSRVQEYKQGINGAFTLNPSWVSFISFEVYKFTVILVGVDAGGTKTIAGAYTCEGKLLGEGRAGPGNYHNVGVEEAISNVNKAITLATAGARPNYLGIGMAGLDTKRDFDIVFPLVSGLAEHVILEHDDFSSLYGETKGRAGVLVVAGTGSVIVALDSQGRRFRVSDWGWFLGDEGSAYEIGRKALRLTVKMLDGRRERGLLADMILKALSVRDLEGLVSWAYVGPHRVDSVASLSEVVSRAAEMGDEDAIEIIRSSSEDLASSAVLMARRVKVREVYVKGGLFNSKIYERTFSAYLETRGVLLRRASKVDYVGPLLMAADAAGCSMSL